MKNILHRISLFFIALFVFVGLTFTNVSDASELQIVEKIVLTKENPIAYRAWASKDHAYKKAHPWSVVWKDNCARLNIPCTDKAWKKVKVGTVFLLPAASNMLIVFAQHSTVPEAITIVPTRNPALFELALSIPAATHDEVKAVRKELNKAKQEYSENLASVDRKSTAHLSLTGLLVGVVIILGGLLYDTSRQRNSLKGEVRTLRLRLKNHGIDSRYDPPDFQKIGDSPPEVVSRVGKMNPLLDVEKNALCEKLLKLLHARKTQRELEAL